MATLSLSLEQVLRLPELSSTGGRVRSLPHVFSRNRELCPGPAEPHPSSWQVYAPSTLIRSYIGRSPATQTVVHNFVQRRVINAARASRHTLYVPNQYMISPFGQPAALQRFSSEYELSRFMVVGHLNQSPS
jgi:hypothetical protein